MYMPRSFEGTDEVRVARTFAYYRSRAAAMMKALVRLQSGDGGAGGTAVLSRLSLATSGTWSYRLEIETFDGGGMRISEGLFGGKGDDALAISDGGASRSGQSDEGDALPSIYAGAGNNSVALAVQAVFGVDGGDGNDTLSVDAMSIFGIDGGAGDDAIALATSYAEHVYGGAGDDAIAVNAHDAMRVDGGDGRDSIAVRATDIGTVAGGAGEDKIALVADRLHDVDGGAGDDAIRVEAREAWQIDGGAGDDRIAVKAESALVLVGAGSGHDTVTIERVGALDVQVVGGAPVAAWTIERDRGTVRIGFGDGRSLTLEGIEAAGSVVVHHRDGEMLEIKAPVAGPPLDLRV